MTPWMASLDQLFSVYRAQLEAFVARRTRDSQIAADLTQETFLRLARMPDGEKVENLPRFLFTVAANLSRDYLRQTLRWDTVQIDVSDSLPSPAPEIETLIAARQEEALLQEAIEALPPRTRAILLLYRIEGLSYREIATRLAISPRTVEYHLRRALALCRQYLKEAWR